MCLLLQVKNSQENFQNFDGDYLMNLPTATIGYLATHITKIPTTISKVLDAHL